MKIRKSPTLVLSVLEKCIKTLFFSTQVGNLRSKVLSRQAYQNAANVFEKQNDYCFRIMKFYVVLIKYNGIKERNRGKYLIL